MNENIKKKSNLPTLAVILITIFFLGFITYQSMKGFDERLRRVEMPEFRLPEDKLSEFTEKLKIPEELDFLGLPLQQEKKEIQEFISPDKKLKFQYSADWRKIDKEFSQTLKQNILAEEVEILLFAQRTKLFPQTGFAFLIVQKSKIEKETSPEKIIEKIKKDAQKGKVEIEIIKTEKIESQKIILDVKYKKDQIFLFSRKKMVLFEDRVYLIIFLAHQEQWLIFEEEVKRILDSVQIL